MARTERQIAEFMEYYRTAPKDERVWALNHIARQEGKSPAEIRAIYEKFKGNVNLKKGKGAKAPEEFIGSIQKALLEGYSEPQIISMYGTSSTIVQRARKQMKDREPVQLVAVVKSAEQEQLDTSELEVEKHIDELEKKLDEEKPELPRTSENFEIEQKKIPYKKPEIITPPKANNSEEPWKALAEQIARFAAGTFGSGTKITSVYWNSREANANAEVITVDGKIYVIQLEEIGHE